MTRRSLFRPAKKVSTDRRILARFHTPDLDPVAAGAERERARAAGQLAHRDMLEKFGALTPANALEAVDYQAERLKHWQGVLAAEADAARKRR